MSGSNKDMSGILSKNDRRDKESSPEYTGDAVISGVPYYLNAWVNERKDGSGRKYFRITFKPKQPAAAPTNGNGNGRGFESDEVPF